MAVKPENAKLFLLNDDLRVLISERVKFLGIHGEISKASKPALATRLAALRTTKRLSEKCNAHANSKIHDRPDYRRSDHKNDSTTPQMSTHRSARTSCRV